MQAVSFILQSGKRKKVSQRTPISPTFYTVPHMLMWAFSNPVVFKVNCKLLILLL